MNCQPDSNYLITENMWLRQRIVELESRLNGLIDEHKECESNLKAKEQEYLDIIDSSTEGSFICDLVNNEIHYSCEWKKRLGIEHLSPSDAMLASSTCVHPDDIEVMQKAWLNAVANKSPRVRMEFRVRTIDSGFIWILGQAKVTYDQDGTPIKYIGTHIDITDLKKSQALMESEERLSALANFNPCLVFLKDDEGRYLYLNETYAKKFVGTKDWYGKTDFDFWARESAELFQANDTEVLRSGQVHQYLEDSMDLNGTRFCWLCYKFPFTDSLNRRYLAGIGIDATGRIIAEEALHRSESALRDTQRKYQDLVKYAPTGIYEIDFRQQRFLKVNDAMCQVTGYSREELLAMNPLDLMDDPSKLLFQTRLMQWLNGQKPEDNVDYLIQTRDGRQIWANLHVSFTVDENGQPLGAVVVSHDITERKLAEIALQESEQFYRVIFDNSEDSFVLMEAIYDEDGSPVDFKFHQANSPFLTQMGLKTSAIMGRTAREIPLVIDPEWITIADQVLKTGQSKHNEKYVRTVDRWYDIHTFQYSQTMLGQIARDITTKKKAELEIARLDRLNLIGEMAASIGHEIRNPMTSVRGFLQMLGGKPEYEPDQEYFSLMIEELDRANEIITEFLSLAKNKRVELQKYSLDSIIKALYPFMMSDANIREIKLSLDLNSPPYVMVDTGEIRQLILNIVRNGMEAIQNKGSLIIGTGYKNDEVILSIKDDGPGLPLELSDKIGTPFLTTKDSGTGLGLAVCYSIAARNNAKIDYETGPAGTTFYIRFPVQDE